MVSFSFHIKNIVFLISYGVLMALCI